MTVLKLSKKSRTPKIEKLYRDILEKPDRASTYKQMARLMVGMEEYRQAARVLRAGLTQLPDDRGLLEHLARTQQASGFSHAAVKTWRRVINLFPDNYLAYEKLERHYVRSGQAEKAVRMYQRVGEDQPLEEKSLERIVFVCKEAMDVPGALKALKKLVRKFGINYRRCRDLGRYHFKADHFKEASRWLEKAFSFDEGNHDLRLLLALSYARQQRYREAEKHVNVILAEKPKSFAGLINLCEFTIESGDLDKAETVLEKIEKAYRGNSRASLARGEILLRRDDPAEAEKRLRSGIKGTPYYYRWELERGYRLLAESLQRQGENRESEFYRLLSDSLHGAADAYQAFIKLAEDRIAEQDLDTASRVTGLLEGMFPNNTRIIIARARIDIFKGYASRAVEKLNRQLENTPAKFIADKVEGYKVLARAYKNLGDWESSRRSLEQSDLIARSL